ncbi:MAG TPA: aminotransferase class I/II-fold pyridoxal phosphate-dependent enzyme [Candidatus Binatia bacterium]|nr:aminotransferase class I/II-fold pyridoxal phosphate-dependent enzyme [Candidatus Binatia bacterium]
MTYLQRVGSLLDDIRAKQRYRELPERQLANVIDFSSNDYLGLATEPQVVEALKRASRVGSGGARLLAGRHRELSLLEEELASWLGRERALLFSSGYHAAVGAIPVLARCVDAIASDRLNHAALIDGIRLAPVAHAIYDHATVPRTDDRPTCVVSETIFSMEGDAVDPGALLADLGAGAVLLLDEAHALGVAGAEGAGLARDLDDPRVVVLGTLSKALGAHGGFIAGPAPVVELLVNEARAFVFDTALPAAIGLAARIALLLARRADERRARLQANVARLCDGLAAIGLPVPKAAGAIVPMVLGAEDRALRASDVLFSKGIFVPAIRPPTVPAGTSRLRVSVRADHTAEHIDRLVEELGKL